MRWIMAVFFYAVSLLIENCINLVFYNGECQRGVSPPLLKKKILFWLLTYLLLLFIPCLDIFISIIVFGSINQKPASKGTNSCAADLRSNMKNSCTLKCSPQSQEGFDVRMFLNHFLEEI